MLSFLNKNRIEGYLFVLTAAFFWSISGPIAKLAYEHGATAIDAAFGRVAFGALFFGIHAAFTRKYKISIYEAVKLILFGSCCIALINYCFMQAVKIIGAGVATVLMYTAPIYVVIFSYFIFKESITFRKIISIVIAFIGVILISLFTGSEATLNGGVFFGLFAGLFYSIQYITVKIFLTRHDPITIFLYGFIGATLPFLPFTSLSEVAAIGWFSFILIGLLSTYAAYIAYGYALKYLSATKAAVTANIDPLFTALIAWFWWGEIFPLLAIVGGLLIIIAVINIAAT